MWFVLMRAILGPGRALHPDSPVLNSEELGIKLLFFGMVGGLSVAVLAGAWLIVQWRVRREARPRRPSRLPDSQPASLRGEPDLAPGDR